MPFCPSFQYCHYLRLHAHSCAPFAVLALLVWAERVDGKSLVQAVQVQIQRRLAGLQNNHHVPLVPSAPPAPHAQY